jgi:hypothetical protein
MYVPQYRKKDEDYIKQDEYIVTGNQFGTLVIWTQSIKATKPLANDTGTVRLGDFHHWPYTNYT